MVMHPEIRTLAPDDLDRVVTIDQAITQRLRRAFYQKRFAALATDRESVVALGAEVGGKVSGFMLAHVLDGEFGGAAPVGVLDAIGVAPATRRSGVGRSLAAGLEKALKGRGVRELRTEADWTERDLVDFFASLGFRLSPRIVLERGTEHRVPDRGEEDGAGAQEVPGEPSAELSVRSMAEDDLASIVRLDRKITRRDRTPYYERKAAEVLRQSGVRVSLVAEWGGSFAGFVMARVDFGEFGRTEPTAVLDTIGVSPAFSRNGIGRALLSQLVLNLGSLHVERIVTQAAWNDLGLVAFLSQTGFERSQRLSFEKPINV